MGKFTKYQSRMRRMIVKAMSATCIFCLFYIPLTKDNQSNSVGYYTVVLNGQELGAVNSPEDAREAYYNARKQLSQEADDIVYASPDFVVYEESRLWGTRTSVENMEKAIYDNLASSIVKPETKSAYTVRINDFTVTLGSKEEVIELIERTKSAYDENNEFQVAMVSTDTDGKYSIELSKSGFAGKENDLVASSPNGAAVNTEAEAKTSDTGISSLGFNKEISVAATRTSQDNIISVEEALAQVTKETEEKTYYTIVAGDCLSIIAEKNNLSLQDLYDLNEGLHENSFLGIGDQLIVTVPTPELSVVVTERVTYDEEYYADVEYRDNDTMYRGTTNVIRSATPGHRTVVADVSYVDGVEKYRKILDETITSEAVAQIVEVGTLTPPTYVKPIYGGMYTSGFGYRWGSTHTGVDWACSIGTPVMASASGTVVRASWYSTYGYCVDIRHANGVVTRYAHLNSINVSVGQYVNQYNVIAYSGATGYVTGPHLHFEFIINGVQVNPLNYVNKY